MRPTGICHMYIAFCGNVTRPHLISVFCQKRHSGFRFLKTTHRVVFRTCAQQASNSRRRGVQNCAHNFYTKSTENLSIFYMVWTGLDGGSMRNLGIVGRKLVSKCGHFPS